MVYKFSVMTQEQAENIAFNWRYDGKYSFYNMEADKEDLEEFLNREERGNSTFAVTKSDEMVAFISFDKVADRIFDISLGMRPDLTGKGNGIEFLRAGINFIKSEVKPEKITLSVATFNQRAIKLYRKVGFKDVDTFMQPTNGSTFEFLKMEYRC
ncbi:GNAT family N-acetyltransferase [Evansella cellulosilytica]|uniref:GCN5-related N-acetyltransferase n=1 Tax=Evansella cellulosilytica (strain ATCC 21833 / DSM 2522 / FERM P-1141 / JCM 9156 / N-4) TaxID=649639 RepID=E6TRX0_EVAC2|nr:GNAT family N-acetyltransferase [Evansella cellulosilytica]ADU29493.1 GCN5-related N-acetyltransferase [Evansella cellulosilytica DSM 2522]